MVQWNNHGGTVEHLILEQVEQGNRDGGIVEDLMVEERNI